MEYTFKHFGIILLLLLASVSASAVVTSKTWNTTSYPNGGDWNVAASWNENAVPVTGDDITITPTAAITITNVQTLAIKSLTINGSNKVTLSATGKVLTIQTGGTLDIESGNTLDVGTVKIAGTAGSITASGTGSFISACVGPFLVAGVSGTNVIYPFDVTLNGAGAQTLPAYATYTKGLTINQTVGGSASFNGNSTINGTLALTNGIVDCSGKTITLGSSASISGGNNNSFLYLNAGSLVRSGVSSAANLFPIGTVTTYTPLILTNTTGTPDITTKVKPTLTAVPLVAANCVTLEWSIFTSAPTSTDVAFQFNSANFGSGYNVNLGSELGNKTSTYSRISTGSVTGSDPYIYTIAGLNITQSSGTNAYVIGNKAQVLAATVSGAPNIETISPGNDQLSVAFTAPKSDGGSDITNYQYSTNGGTSFISCSPTQTTSPIVITGLINGTSYNVQLRAINGIAGYGTATASKAATPSNTTALILTNGSKVTVHTANNKVIISGATGQMVDIYNAMGKKVSSMYANVDDMKISINEKGIYLIKVANQISKILL